MTLAADLVPGPAAAVGAEESPAWQPDFAAWPLPLAMHWRAVAGRAGTAAWVLRADRPADRQLLQLAEAQLRGRVQWAVCAAVEVDAWLAAGASQFRALDSLQPSATPADDSRPAYEVQALSLEDGGTADISPVVSLLDAVLHDALQDEVSDVHIERHGQGADVRFRVDGVMVAVRGIEGVAMAERVVSRLKVMAELDIGERRLPQDGRFRLRLKGRVVDLRLSIMPTIFGEDAVLRILDRMRNTGAQQAMSLQALGFDEATRSQLLRLGKLPHGMLLVTGPTGSGKTTTLYALISEVQTGREKIVTIEDPVEMQLAGVTQIPVNERKGLDFARGLRSILRHDPDRVMVGEIRDPETAQIAVQAALTGHLVFSTVHANNALDVIGRFLHMGLDPYHVVSSLTAVLAQRLMRINCLHCAAPMAPDAAVLARFGLAASGHHFKRGLGCMQCRSTGYKGRRAVAELLTLDDELRDLISNRAPTARIKAHARAHGLVSLREHALAWVCQGLTTFDELERVTLVD